MTFTSTLSSTFAHTIRQQHMLHPGDTLIVAISGGADSTALLDLLARLPGYHLRLIAAHLNHCLRGDASDADQDFCRTLAAGYGIPCEVRRLDISALATAEGLNLEDAGRRARIAFFDQLREKHGAAAVVLAHHADDQAETVLMRLLRGSGMTGLSGMACRNARGYLRPLLGVTRTEIERYLQERGLAWREDASNRDTTYLRNRIRHELLPLLETYNPAIRTGLASTAERIAGDEALLAELTETAFSSAYYREGNRIVATIRQLRSLHPALQRRTLRHAFNQVAGTLAGLSQRHISSICALLASERPNARLALPHAVTLLREYDRLIWLPANRQSTCPTADDGNGFELMISAPGRYRLTTGSSLIVETVGSASCVPDATLLCLDLAALPFPWHVRSFQAGDRLQPFGMQGRKKVKDIFIDRKILISERRRIPLLFCGEELIWIAGVCVSEICRRDHQSQQLVQVRLHASDSSCELG